jgi:hypothetical protein
MPRIKNFLTVSNVGNRDIEHALTLERPQRHPPKMRKLLLR